MRGEVQGTGMGMQLLHGLARSLEGNVEFITCDTGTRVLFTFPAPLRTTQEAPAERTYLH
jgi:two-component sensor histidine kinase